MALLTAQLSLQLKTSINLNFPDFFANSPERMTRLFSKEMSLIEEYDDLTVCGGDTKQVTMKGKGQRSDLIFFTVFICFQGNVLRTRGTNETLLLQLTVTLSASG